MKNVLGARLGLLNKKKVEIADKCSTDSGLSDDESSDSSEDVENVVKFSAPEIQA